MVGLSFSGKPVRGPFWWQIITQQKIHTAREPRKRPLKIGDPLQMYWKMRVPKDKKPIHLIGTAEIAKLETKQYHEFGYSQEFARNDGFLNTVELNGWFGNPALIIDGWMIYEIIHWGKLELSDDAKKIIERCIDNPAYPDYRAYVEEYELWRKKHIVEYH